MRIYEVTFKYVPEEGNPVTKTFNNDIWWDGCHAQNEMFIKRNFTDKGIKLKYYEILNTASYELREEPF